MALYALYLPRSLPLHEEPPFGWVRSLMGRGQTPEEAQADALTRYRPQDAEVRMILDATVENSWMENRLGLPEIRRCGPLLENYLLNQGEWPEQNYLEEQHPLEIQSNGMLELRKVRMAA